MRPTPAPLVSVGGMVTSVERIKGNPRRVAVYLDGQLCIELNELLASECSMRVGEQVSSVSVRQAWEEDQRRCALERAMHFLSYRNRTVQEVRRKLSGLGFAAFATDSAVARLLDLGYLDDEAFAAPLRACAAETQVPWTSPDFCGPPACWP